VIPWGTSIEYRLLVRWFVGPLVRWFYSPLVDRILHRLFLPLSGKSGKMLMHLLLETAATAAISWSELGMYASRLRRIYSGFGFYVMVVVVVVHDDSLSLFFSPLTEGYLHVWILCSFIAVHDRSKIRLFLPLPLSTCLLPSSDVHYPPTQPNPTKPNTNHAIPPIKNPRIRRPLDRSRPRRRLKRMERTEEFLPGCCAGGE
jgi:hypothetical protein